MGIKRYTADADNTITNAYKSNLTTRATASNMGLSDSLEVFRIYGQESSGSSELSRVLVQFPVSDITTDRNAGTIPASGNVSFYLRMFNAKHPFTLDGENIAIGLDMKIYVPCPSIEHYYFLGKYIIYYHLFLLFNHASNYIKKVKKQIKITNREQTLYKIFLPVMQPLFGVTNEKISSSLVFSYYTLDQDELEVIYNKFLVNKIRNIEKKLFNYFLLRCSI